MAIPAPRVATTSRAQAADDGVAGNGLLTGLTGALLLAPLALEGLTILRIGQMIWLHMFVGLLLLGLIGLKLASTGYRFLGYYTGRSTYLRHGPPVTPLRLLAIPLVLSTLGVMATGVLLLVKGPNSTGLWTHLLFLHKGFFIVWVAVTAIHVLAHLFESWNAVQDDLGVLSTGTPRVGRRGVRLLVIATALMAGLVIAVIAAPHFGSWQHAMSIGPHDG